MKIFALPPNIICRLVSSVFSGQLTTKEGPRCILVHIDRPHANYNFIQDQLKSSSVGEREAERVDVKSFIGFIRLPV